jgi:hypothetical protein
MTFSRHATLLVLIALSIALLGCVSEQALWDATRQKNTISGYEEYLSKSREHGWQDANAAAARARIAELRYADARERDTPAAYKEYLQQEPRSSQADEARARLARLEAAAAAQRAELARKTVDDEAYAPFSGRPALDTAIKYLRSTPGGTHVSEVTRWLESKSDLGRVPDSQLLISLGRARSLPSVNVSTGQMNWGAQGFEHVTREIHAKRGSRLIAIGIYFGNLGAPQEIGSSAVSIVSDRGSIHPCIGWLMAERQVRSSGTFKVNELSLLPAVFELPVGSLDSYSIAIDGRRTLGLKDLKVE